MSAFMVSDDTIRDALVILMGGRPSFERYDFRWYDMEGGNLIRLNQQALIERYGEKKAGPMSDVTERCAAFKHDGRTIDAVNVKLLKCLKAAQCVLYQCAEGKIPETSVLYKELENQINAVCRDVVSKMPEYVAAPWG